jgi:hypothetical protein
MKEMSNMAKSMQFKDYSEKVKSYCLEHNLDYKALISSPSVRGIDKIIFMHFEETPTSHLGLKDTELMPQTLIVQKLDDGSVEIKETEYTKIYLSA